MLHIFLIFLLAHFLADFVFQTDKMAKYKGEKIVFTSLKENYDKFISLFTHIITHILILICVLFIFYKVDHSYIEANLIQIIYMCVGVIFTHTIIDCFKYFFYSKLNFKELSVFLLDQFLHIFFIYIFIFFVLKRDIKEIFLFLDSNLYSNYNLIVLDKILLIIIIGLIGTYFAAYFNGLYLKRKPLNSTISDNTRTISKNLSVIGFEKKSVMKVDSIKIENKTFIHSRDDSAFAFGKAIGIVERTLIILLISTNNYGIIAIVIGLKTLTRFKMIEQNKDFGEYYLMGNLLSLAFSITCGMLIKFIL